MTPVDVAEARSELRRRMRLARARLAKADPMAAERAAALAPMERLTRFAAVAGYHAMGGEMDARPLLARLEAAGCAILLPFAPSREAPLEFRRPMPGGDLPDAFGIPSPGHGPHERPDLVIAPVLAFDGEGARLGQGAGCYDCTIAQLRRSGPVFLLGLAYAGQEVERIETMAHDVRLDAVLTERGYSAFA